jgi:hypothetical protein
MFFDDCAAAGKERCAFWEEKPEAIRAKWDLLQERINKAPAPVYISPSSAAGPSGHGCSSTPNEAESEATYGILDSTVLREVVFNSFYWPYSAFQPLATALEALYTDYNPAPLYSLFAQELGPQFKCPSSCDSGSSKAPQKNDEVGWAISCQDGPHLPGTLEDNEEFISRLKALNGDWWDMWAGNRLSCSGYPRFPKNHFRGVFLTHCNNQYWQYCSDDRSHWGKYQSSFAADWEYGRSRLFQSSG